MKRSAPRDLFWLWDRVSSFIHKNITELWVMETENGQKSENWVMETELSFDQTTFLLWVPPFLSYELWKLRIELWKLLIQTGSEHPKYPSSLMLILVREYAAIAAYRSMWQQKERDKHLRSTWSWALHMILEHKPLSFCCHISLYAAITLANSCYMPTWPLTN